MIKAIETSYNGYRFRSRLEARWGIYFDSIGVAWEYEYEGFKMPSGVQYLPDFYFPEMDVWVEIKPSMDLVSFKELMKMLEFGESKMLVVIFGTPSGCRARDSMNEMIMLSSNTIWDGMRKELTGFFNEGIPEKEVVSEGFCLVHDNGLVRFALCPMTNKITFSHVIITPDEHGLFYRAEMTARSARFEFGEHP